MDRNNVAVLDPKVVSDDSVDASAAVIDIIVGQHDEDRVLPLLAANQNGITTEKTERLHGILGEGDDGVVIVGSIRDPAAVSFAIVRYLPGSRTSVGWASSSS